MILVFFVFLLEDTKSGVHVVLKKPIKLGTYIIFLLILVLFILKQSILGPQIPCRRLDMFS